MCALLAFNQKLDATRVVDAAYQKRVSTRTENVVWEGVLGGRQALELGETTIMSRENN